MDGKELYELLDTVSARMPDDAAAQEFTALVRELIGLERTPDSERRNAVLRWLREVGE